MFIQLEILREIEIEVNVARPAHHTHSGGTERLRRRSKRRECIGVEPSLNRALRCGKLWVPNQIGPRLAFAAKAEHRTAAKRCGEAKSSLNRVDAGELP